MSLRQRATRKRRIDRALMEVSWLPEEEYTPLKLWDFQG
jgi:hypothetical protein